MPHYNHNKWIKNDNNNQIRWYTRKQLTNGMHQGWNRHSKKSSSKNICVLSVIKADSVYACKKHAPVNCRGMKIGRLQCTEIQGRKVDVRWAFVYLRKIDSAKVFPLKRKTCPSNCRGVTIGRPQCTEIQGHKVDVRWVFVYLRRIDSAKVFPFSQLIFFVTLLDLESDKLTLTRRKCKRFYLYFVNIEL